MRRGGTFSIASSSSSFSRHVGGCYCYAIRERARHAARRHVMRGGDRDLDRHRDESGGPSNEREL